jgi:hypothetical protein
MVAQTRKSEWMGLQMEKIERLFAGFVVDRDEDPDPRVTYLLVRLSSC